jgi:uncharacterized phage protein gp47/JayE
MANTIIESADKILDRAMTQLKENTQITRFNPGSKARTILDIFSHEIERLEEILSSNMILSLVSGASGIYLDFLGELVGVQRAQRTPAAAVSGDQAIRIYVDEGLTFGSLNNGRSINVPPGTIISSSDDDIKFNILHRSLLLPDANEFYVSARSLRFGTAGNVGKGVLSKIHFENYATFPTTQLKVENLSSIDSGQESDSDAFYRFKITNALLAGETGNATAIRLAALSVQSVADVVILPMIRGIGTSDVILDTINGDVSNVTLESVGRAVASVKSLGMDILVRAPSLVGLEIALDITYVKGLSAKDKQDVNTNIRQAVSNLIATAPLGTSVNLNILSNTIINSDKRIADIGTPGKPLSEVILWRDSLITGGRRPTSTTNTNVILLVDERLTLEGAPNTSIRIVEK